MNEVSLPRMIQSYMKNVAIEQFKRNPPLAYANILTLIFKRFDNPISKEKYIKEPLDIIDKTTLFYIKYRKIDDKWIHPNDMTSKWKATGLASMALELGQHSRNIMSDTLTTLLSFRVNLQTYFIGN